MSNRIEINRILAPVDINKPVSDILAYTASVSQHYQCEKVFVQYVAEMPAHLEGSGVSLDSEAETTSRARDVLENLIAEHLDGCPADIVVSTGHPYEQILELRERIQADLIVIGSHCGGQSVSRMFLGGVTDKIVRSAPCPVLTVRSS